MSAPALTGYETLLFERPSESILLVRLNRPERLNAITFRMFAEFQRLSDELSEDLTTRVVVLTGAGRGFCSGLDLDEAATLPEMTTAEMLNGQDHWAGAMASLRRVPQPIIAAVNGAATGGGLAVALAADIRLASPEARFNAGFVKIGLTAGDVGVSWHLPRVVGLGRAAEIMLTGRFVGADEAERIGLVNHVVASEELVPASLELAEQIAAHSPLGIRLTKSVLQANVDAGSLESAIELENRGQVLATRSPDMAEALQAFRAGRPQASRAAPRSG